MGKRTLIPFLLLLSDGGDVALDGYLDLIDSDLASLAIIGFTIVYGLYVNETALGFFALYGRTRKERSLP